MTDQPGTPHPPRITDAEVDRLPVDAGLDALLTGLLAETAAPRSARSATAAARVGPGRRRAWPVALVAAAAVVATVAVPSYLLREHDGAGARVGAAGDPTSATPSTGQSSSVTAPTRATSGSGTTVQDAEWRNPPTSFAVLDAPGWGLDEDSVSTSNDTGLEFGYRDGDRTLTLSWVPAAQWDALYADNTQGQSLSDVEVLGRPAVWLAEASHQQFAFLGVRDGYGLRFDAAFTTPGEFLDLLGHLRGVDQQGLTAALPADVVGPGEAHDAETQMLRGADLPDPLTVRGVVGFNAPYQVGASVIADVGCAWGEQWVGAREDHDRAGMRAARDALAGSRTWPIAADVLDQPGWFDDAVRAMDGDDEQRVLTASGCDLNELHLTYDADDGTLSPSGPGSLPSLLASSGSGGS